MEETQIKIEQKKTSDKRWEVIGNEEGESAFHIYLQLVVHF